MTITSEVKLTAAVRKRRRQLAVQCVQLKHELGAVALFTTMQAMEAAVTAVGYEIAEDEITEDERNKT